MKRCLRLLIQGFATFNQHDAPYFARDAELRKPPEGASAASKTEK